MPERTRGEAQAGSSERKRYRVLEREGEQVIISGNAPNISLHIERGLTIDSRGRRRYGPQTIFLDGVYDGAPFCDNESRHYSLDHHAGCVRGFTLATCEQAVVMLLQGLPLSSGSWSVYVNDPDLDSVLAAWVLLNHLELLRNDRVLLRKVMPLIRLEGVIDAHGTDKELLAALPRALYRETRAQIDALMARERELKSAGSWMTADWLAYACATFEKLDRLVFPDGALDALLEIQETGRSVLDNDRIAMVVESELGIYEVESRLKERQGDVLGVIVLKTGDNRYTLRLVDTFLRKDLTAVYKALNRADPKARLGGDAPNAWGGSGDIGGSPRKTGTGLSGDEILEVLSEVLGERQPWWRKLLALAVAMRRKKTKAKQKQLPPGPD